MKSISIRALRVVALLMLGGAGFVPLAQADDTNWTYPVIKYGPVQPLPKAAVQPKADQVYKALFDVTSAIKDPTKPESGLVHVARAVNVFASAGVSTQNLEFVAILHGPSTTAILNNEAYKKKYGVENPNLPLIDALTEAGVHVDVCGQALAENSIAHSEVYGKVQIDLSALATTVIYGDMGYAYMKQ